jgi:predicted lipid-binding transport protein (Tim44 family)
MQVQFDGRGRGPLESILYGTLLIAVLVLGFFFLVAALIAGAVLASVILLRLWWLKRKLDRAARDEFITTEYRVVERDQLDAPPRNDGRGPDHEAGR